MDGSCCFRAPWVSKALEVLYEWHSFSSHKDVVVNLSAILEDHSQRAPHPEWAVPAVLEDYGLESELMLEPGLYHRFRPHMDIIVELITNIICNISTILKISVNNVRNYIA